MGPWPDSPPALTIMQFRNDFPEFADPSAYPDATITVWMNVGVARLNQWRWNGAGLYTIGIELFTAHFLVLAVADQQAAAAGAAPGQATSVKAAKSVGGVSVSIDTNISSDPRAAHGISRTMARGSMSWPWSWGWRGRRYD